MKLKNMLFFVAALTTFSLFSLSAQSQVQIGVNGGRLEGTGSSQWGFGAHVKYLIADKFAIGVAARGYPKNVKTSDVSFGGNNYKMAQGNTLVPVTASLDYYFGKAPVRPYIGADAGAYFRQYVLTITQNNGNSSYYNTSDKKTFFGAAPRAGLNVELGPVGIFGQAGYNFLFGSGDKNKITVPGVNSDLDTKPADKFWTFDVGVFFKIGGGK
ncbi:MAG: OmpW family outer membrane protein [Agriterribacter sp.]